MFKFLYIALFLLFLYAPIAVLVANSFNLSIYGNNWEGFTLRWYESLKYNSCLLQAAKNSIVIATLSAFLAVVFAVLTAFIIYKYKFPGRTLLFISIQSMIVFPDIIFAISLSMLFIVLKAKLGFTTILLSHTALSAPVTSMIIFLGFSKIEKTILETAKDLGASDLQIFVKIFLPLVSHSIIAAYLIAFTISFDDVIISSFVSSPSYDLLPLKIISLARFNMKPEINAICVIILITSIFLVSSSQFLLRDKNA
jgi:spermidine/putrescine transport system permease protein